MTEINIQSLIDISSSTDVSALLSAKESAKQRMISDPTAANVSGYDRASAMLNRAIANSKASDTVPEPEAPGLEKFVESKFRKISEVVKWLKDEGYKIKKSKIYMDAKAGYLVSAPDGGYTQEAVLAYVFTQSLDKVADNKAGKLDELSEKRLEKEVEKLTVQVEKLTWDMNRDQGKYLLKDDVRMELALKISVFEAGFKHSVITRAQDWVAAVGGMSEKYQVLVDLIYASIDSLLSEFAEVPELDLIVMKSE